MTFGERVKLKREQLGYSQEDLAIKIGFKSRSSINKIEKGVNNVTQSVIIKLADALNTTTSYLMGWEINRDGIDFIAEHDDNKYYGQLKDIAQNVSDEKLIEIIKYAKYLIGDEKK